jgi:hypothetical protein
LLHRARAVFSGAHVFDFLPDEFSGLRHRGLSCAPRPLSASECFRFRHDVSLAVSVTKITPWPCSSAGCPRSVRSQ